MGNNLEIPARNHVPAPIQTRRGMALFNQNSATFSVSANDPENSIDIDGNQQVLSKIKDIENIPAEKIYP